MKSDSSSPLHCIANPRDLSVQQLVGWTLSILSIIWCLGWTVAIMRAAYSPLPWGDLWWDWRAWEKTDNPLWQLWSLHNEHRILTARVLFRIDEYLCSASGVFLFAAILATQIAHIVLLNLWAKPRIPDARIRLFLLATTSTILLAPQQLDNLTWSFQVQFVGVYFAANFAFFAIARAADKPRSASRIVLPSILAWLAAYTMSNGLLVWPALLLYTLLVRAFSSREKSAIATQTVACWATYLIAYATPARHGSLIDGLLNLPQTLAFFFVYLGSPFSKVVETYGGAFFPNGSSPNIAIAALTGLVIAGISLHQLDSALRQRFREPHAMAMVAAKSFLLASAAVTAVGRSSFLPITEAACSRYTTPALVLWSILLVDALSSSPLDPRIRRRNMPAAIFVCALFLPLYTTFYVNARGKGDYLRPATEAVRSNVFDFEVWRRLGLQQDHVTAMQPTVDYFRTKHLAVFSDPRNTWIGKPLASIFEVSQERARGFVDHSQVIGGPHGGWKLDGWAFHSKINPRRQTVVAVDGNGVILGLFGARQPRDDVHSAHSEVSRDCGWMGYIADSTTESAQFWLIDTENLRAFMFADRELPHS